MDATNRELEAIKSPAGARQERETKFPLYSTHRSGTESTSKF